MLDGTSPALKGVIRKYAAAKARGKAAYQELDELTNTLIEAMPRGKVVVVDGRSFVLEDNFKTKNKVFRVAGVSRFELKEV